MKLVILNIKKSSEYVSEVDEWIKYVIAHSSKETLFQTDMNSFNALHIAVIKREKEYIDLILKRARDLGCENDLENAKTNDDFKHYIKSEYIESINLLSKLDFNVHRCLYDPNEYVRITDILLYINNENQNSVYGKTYKKLKSINDNVREFVLYSIYPIDFSCYRQNVILKK